MYMQNLQWMQQASMTLTEPAEAEAVIVGLIFLRYISGAFEKRYEELLQEGDGFENDRDAYAEENIFFVSEDARWRKIASAAHTPEVGTVIDDAMRAMSAAFTIVGANAANDIAKASAKESTFLKLFFIYIPSFF